MLIEHSRQTNALDLCGVLRGKGKTMPIVIMSKDGTQEDKISLLNAGADDCVDNTCSIAELSARVRAMLRRPQTLVGDIIKLGDLTMDTVRYKVTRGEKQIILTRKEFGLLEYLLRNQDAVISRTALIEHVWDINADLFSNTLETHILNLRRKIEAEGKPKLIHTISGRGYKIALG
jgi:DNA-binding response OmpR family regulator